MDERPLSREEIRRVLLRNIQMSVPGVINVENSISDAVYRQAQAAGFIDENGRETEALTEDLWFDGNEWLPDP